MWDAGSPECTEVDPDATKTRRRMTSSAAMKPAFTLVPTWIFKSPNFPQFPDLLPLLNPSEKTKTNY